jgi:hypothetical protein
VPVCITSVYMPRVSVEYVWNAWERRGGGVGWPFPQPVPYRTLPTLADPYPSGPSSLTLRSSRLPPHETYGNHPGVTALLDQMR